MTEYFTEAIVLDRAPRGETDEFLTLYTRSLGKVSVVTKSSRAPLSKLSGHLNVGRLIKARIIRTSRFQLVDAMSENINFNGEILSFVKFINQMTSEGSADPHLWAGIDFVMRSSELVKENYYDKRESQMNEDSFGPSEVGTKVPSRNLYMPRVYRRFLDILGYGAKFAKCGDCGSNKIAYFLPSDIIFLCANSLNKRGLNEKELVPVI